MAAEPGNQDPVGAPQAPAPQDVTLEFDREQEEFEAVWCATVTMCFVRLQTAYNNTTRIMALGWPGCAAHECCFAKSDF